MSEQFWEHILIAFIGTLPLIIGAAGALILALRKIEQIHKATNSLVKELVAAEKQESFAAGEKSEKDKNDPPAGMRPHHM